ncbi:MULTISPECIES: alpha/beta hydrolase [unclassified Bacillus (in: firmicutes)]|uniref:alpha/beta hydrolase n=1 Tax=Bacillaceae TaxID=186817 RepID=UPI001559EB9E|nr:MULTISPECIES: alpha/beta hydrolase [unclassified Bacillus (in: firmicutes)]QKE75402.1 alpha/beta hydrolase [Arthrobacter citreus]
MKKIILAVVIFVIVFVGFNGFPHKHKKKVIVNKNIIVQRDVRYTNPAQVPQTFDLYRSKNAHGPAPTLIFVHGGSWRYGSKELNKRWQTIFNEIVNDGYTAISINYTLYSKENYSYNFPVNDVKTAINFIYDNSTELGINRNQIGLAGASAGGHLALLTGLQPDIQSKIKYMIAWYPISDLTTMNQSPTSRSSEIVDKYMNSTVDQMTAEYNRMSPIQYVAKTKVPIFIVHGTGDKLVPFSQSKRFAKKNPKMVTLIPLKNGNHGFTNLSIQKSTNDTINYLKARLKK